ncbi:MAG: carbohydrate binding domain-containing protein [Flavisolibacter sp.]|nr:carbohydrate binding domain-containing protein [Flavisolibacter sp.]
MNLLRLKTYLLVIVSVSLQLLVSCSYVASTDNEVQKDSPGVAVLLVDTDHPISKVDENIYGQFLEHINHSVIDGLYAEQVQGQGFEGKDFETHWKSVEKNGKVTLEDINFQKGLKSIRLSPSNGTAGVQQQRLYVKKDVAYNGSLWVQGESGKPELQLRVVDKNNNEISKASLSFSGNEWQEVKFQFTPSKTDTAAVLEIIASGTGSLLIDFISIMTADSRSNGKFRPDLLESLKGLKPTFIRWPGGSFASTYKWQDGIGPAVSRVYHPNVMWGGYADYYGFGTDEFLEMCRQLGSDPMIVLAAPSTKAEDVEYAMNWVRYLIDPPTTQWGKLRAANGHPQPYRIPYIQIDNEPMNNGFTPESYAEIVNVYGSQLRKIAPGSRIVACGQKRSNDLNWSQKVIDIAGNNFDILGCHNYEYEPENFASGVQRISDYLTKLDHFIRNSSHPAIKVAVLEWSLCRSYDWRAGLHAAGSLIAYERLSPSIDMTCPALLMRNTTDNPEWRAFIYHDHVSWFPGSGYVVEKLFRDHYAPVQLASTSGTVKDIQKRSTFFDTVSQMKPVDWTPETIDAIATKSADGKRVVIKAVNYKGVSNTLLVRLQGSSIADGATVKTYTMRAGLDDAPSMEHPDAIKPVEGTVSFAKDMSFKMEPYSVLVIEVTAK